MPILNTKTCVNIPSKSLTANGLLKEYHSNSSFEWRKIIKMINSPATDTSSNADRAQKCRDFILDRAVSSV